MTASLPICNWSSRRGCQGSPSEARHDEPTRPYDTRRFRRQHGLSSECRRVGVIPGDSGLSRTHRRSVEGARQGRGGGAKLEGPPVPGSSFAFPLRRPSGGAGGPTDIELKEDEGARQRPTPRCLWTRCGQPRFAWGQPVEDTPFPVGNQGDRRENVRLNPDLDLGKAFSTGCGGQK